MAGRDPLGPPGQDEQQRPAGEPAAEVGDRVEGRVVGGMDVVEEDHAGRRPGTGGAEHGGDALEQAHLRARSAERQQVARPSAPSAASSGSSSAASARRWGGTASGQPLVSPWPRSRSSSTTGP